MPYKVLIILTRPFDPNAGGVQRSTYKISSYLKEHGCDTNVFSFYTNGHKPQDVATLHTAKSLGAHANKDNFKRLEFVIKDIKPDIVINQMPYEILLGKTLKRAKSLNNFLLLGCLRNTLYPVKLNIDKYLEEVVPKFLHKTIDNNAGRSLFQKIHSSRHTKILKFILDTYDNFVMFGPPNIEELKYFIGDYKLDKVRLIPNSILSVLQEVPPKEKRILWLSRLSYKQKRADLILPFWKEVMHKLPDWQFDIVGDGDAFKDLKAQIKEEEIPRVKMYGKQVPYEYYKQSPIYIMTSAFEGFPNTLIEAQSFGAIPVVYDNYPVCSWVVKEGKSGILISPFDVNQMAKEVVDLAKDQDRQNILMQAALENAREFDLQNVGKQWLDFFDCELKNNLK
jgi:glycosyltransferase involved in cell wall biosynthesis